MTKCTLMRGVNHSLKKCTRFLLKQDFYDILQKKISHERVPKFSAVIYPSFPLSWQSKKRTYYKGQKFSREKKIAKFHDFDFREI